MKTWACLPIKAVEQAEALMNLSKLSLASARSSHGTKQDVLKAMAMGAKGTYIGRAFIYGLGAMGQAGVTRALEVIHKELDTTMALCGETKVTGLGRHNLLVPKHFEGDWQD